MNRGHEEDLAEPSPKKANFIEETSDTNVLKMPRQHGNQRFHAYAATNELLFVYLAVHISFGFSQRQINFPVVKNATEMFTVHHSLSLWCLSDVNQKLDFKEHGEDNPK